MHHHPRAHIRHPGSSPSARGPHRLPAATRRRSEDNGTDGADQNLGTHIPQVGAGMRMELCPPARDLPARLRRHSVHHCRELGAHATARAPHWQGQTYAYEGRVLTNIAREHRQSSPPTASTAHYERRRRQPRRSSRGTVFHVRTVYLPRSNPPLPTHPSDSIAAPTSTAAS